MKLAELLAAMPEAMREQLAEHNGRTGDTRDLKRLLCAEETIHRWYGAMYELERRVLALIVRRFGQGRFDLAQLEKAGRKETSGAALKVALIRLEQKGVLFALRRKWGEADYLLPEDSFPLWRPLLVPVSASDTVYAGADAVSDSPYRPGMAVHMLAVLAYIAKEEVTITQKGGMHKRHAGRLAALVSVRDEPLRPVEGEAAFAFAKADYGSLAVSFLIGAALRLGLLESADGRLAVNPSRLGDWCAMSGNELDDRLYTLWKEATVSPDDVGLQHAICIAEQMPLGSWLPVVDVDRRLKEAGVGAPDARRTAGESGSELPVRLQAWIARLAEWGWGETGTSARGSAFRWYRRPFEPSPEVEAALPADDFPNAAQQRPAGRAALFVQPDFDLIVPPDCPYMARWELEMIAVRVRHEHMAVYRITRESVMRALNRGRTAEGIIRFLEGSARHGVPDSVRTAIAHWGEQHGQLRVETVTVVRFRDEKTARAVRGDERIASLLAEELGPTVWTVRTDKAAELRAALERAGFSPGGGGSGGTGEPLPALAEESAQRERSDSRRAGEGCEELPAEGLIYSKAAVQYYGSERIFPLIEDVYPGLQEVPPMWLKDCRTYHVSTRKQIIQKALDWKACLRLRKAGADTLLIPLRLDGIRDDWAVTGFEQMNEVRLAPDEWEEMQLILPGINDESR